MDDPTFDALLKRTLRAYADGGVRGIDAMAIAASAAPARSTIGVISRRFTLAIVVALLMAVLAAAAVLFAGGPTPVTPRGDIVPVGDLTTARARPALVRLPDGRVVVAGGAMDDIRGAGLEVFDPTTNAFTAIPGAPITGSGPGVALPNGQVLLQLFDSNSVRSSAVVVDPVTGLITATPVTAIADLTEPALAPLHDGRVLVVGGEAVQDQAPPFRTTLRQAELFDPATRTFTTTGSMALPRLGHAALTLLDGRVLVVAGDGRYDAEIYEPATGRFSSAGPLPSVRHDALAVRLADGRVVIFERAGVTAFDGSPARSTTGAVDLYDPTTGTFRAARPTPHVAATATLLPDGRVYLTGGWDDGGGGATWAGIYDALTGTTTDATAPRSSILTPVALADGRILFVYEGSAEAAVFRLEQSSPSPGNP